jgi:hypothetical protein
MGGVGVVGNLNIAGDLTGIAYSGRGELTVGLDVAGGTLYPENLVQFTSNANSFSRVSLQNISTQQTASSEFVALTNNGSNGSGYIATGIAGINFNSTVFANGGFAAAGDAQAGEYVLRASVTTSTGLNVLTTNGLTSSTNNQVILPDNSSYMFKAMVTAKAVTSNDEGAWEFNGSIARYSGSTSTVLRVANKTKIWASQNYDVTVYADTVNGGLAISAVGTNTNAVRFVAKVDTVQVTT